MLQRSHAVVRADTRAQLLLLCVLLCAGAQGLLALAPARAEGAPYTAYLCEGPAGPREPVGAAGLRIREPVEGEATRFAAKCAGLDEELSVELDPGKGALAPGEGSWFVYEPPAKVTISAFALQAAGEVHGCSGCAAEAFVRYPSASGATYLFRDGDGAASELVGATGLTGVHALEFGVACAAGGAPCSGEGTLASLAVPFGELTLEDGSLPSARITEAPAQPLSGTATWSYTAADPGGGGIFRAGVLIDGSPLGHAHVVEEEGGRCRMLDLGSVRAFIAPRPCPESVSSTFSLPTETLPDGSYALEAYVEDVAGARATIFAATVRSQNAPALTEPAAISASPVLGTPLSAAAPIFTAPSGDVIASESYQWERCTAAGCAPIAGATSLVYTPTAADVGARLALLASATDAATVPAPGDIAHTTSALSAQSAPVAPAPCASVCVSRAGEAKPWRVRFAVRPRRVHRHSRILLRGRVISRPLPESGKLIFLQARSIVRLRPRGRRARARTLRGGWITFMVLRSRANGAFSAHYRFRLGGRHIYQFRAVAPAEGLFRNPTGASRPVTVYER